MFGGKKLQAGLLKGADAVVLTCFQFKCVLKRQCPSTFTRTHRVVNVNLHLLEEQNTLVSVLTYKTSLYKGLLSSGVHLAFSLRHINKQ